MVTTGYETFAVRIAANELKYNDGIFHFFFFFVSILTGREVKLVKWVHSMIAKNFS